MTKYREILRLKNLGISQQSLADSCNVSKKTVNRVLKRAEELDISRPFDENETDDVLAEKFFPSAVNQINSQKRMLDYAYIRKELLRNGVSKKLLLTEYMEDCRTNGDEPLMYSQFCWHIQQDEQKHRATMHINRKPGEQVEVDWAGDPASIIDPDTGEIIKTYIFVGVMTYSQYAYVEAFMDMKQKSWINAHVHMYEYFCGVAKILVPDNCKTAVIHNNSWNDQLINETYQEMAEHYGTAIMLEEHQKNLEWNGKRFRKWAERIGINTYTVVNSILTSKGVEQQTYRSCMGLLKLAEKYSDALLEEACKRALSYTASPSYKSIKNILVTGAVKQASANPISKETPKTHGITRGADYYRR